MSKVDFTVGYEFSSDELKKLKGAITDAFAGIDISSAVEESAKAGASKAEPSINYGELAGYVQKGMRGLSGYSELIGATSKLFKEGFGIYSTKMGKDLKEARQLGGVSSTYSVSGDRLRTILNLFENMNVSPSSFDKFTDLSKEKKELYSGIIKGKLGKMIPFLKGLSEESAGEKLRDIGGIRELEDVDLESVKMLKGNITGFGKIAMALSEKGGGVEISKHLQRILEDTGSHTILKDMLAKQLTGTGKGQFPASAISKEVVIGDNPNKPVDILVRDITKNILGVIETKSLMGGTSAVKEESVISQVKNLAQGFTNELKKEAGEGNKVSEERIKALLKTVFLGYGGKSVTRNLTEEVIKNDLMDMLSTRISRDLGVPLGKSGEMVEESMGKREDVFRYYPTASIEGLIETNLDQFKEVFDNIANKMSESAKKFWEETQIGERLAILDENFKKLFIMADEKGFFGMPPPS